MHKCRFDLCACKSVGKSSADKGGLCDNLFTPLRRSGDFLDRNRATNQGAAFHVITLISLVPGEA